jgi:hypothetical protein
MLPEVNSTFDNSQLIERGVVLPEKIIHPYANGFRTEVLS